MSENLHRNELKDVEKGFGILSIFESNGYNGDQAIQGTKSLDNWFHDHQGKGWDDLIRELSSGIKPRHQANELRYDKNFLDSLNAHDWGLAKEFLQVFNEFPNAETIIVSTSRD